MNHKAFTDFKNPSRTWEWIKVTLKRQGKSLASVARTAKVPYSVLCESRKRAYPRSDEIIAAAVSVPVATLWPTRYDVDGLPKPVSRKSVARPATQNGKVNRNVEQHRRAA